MSRSIVDGFTQILAPFLERNYTEEQVRKVVEVKFMPEIERLLAAERGRAEIDSKVYWGSELECGHVRMNLVNYPETGSTVCRACVSEEKAVAAQLRNLQPAASDLEAYVKNLPLSEIARIKGIPGIAKLGKTYDRPDFYATEDE